MGNVIATEGGSSPGLPAQCPVDHKSMAANGAAAPQGHAFRSSEKSTGLPETCPVDHKSMSGPPASSLRPAGLPSECPVNHGAAGAAISSSGGAGGRSRGTIYNVYAQPIDPTNNMPATANQQKAPGQAEDLSTHRVQSSIPKGGTESTWQYPSPQMFWNSLVRKGKAEGAAESDMAMVVAIHNEMNERTWRHLLEWEHGLHAG